MTNSLPYVVFYDGHCQLCTDSKRMLEQMDASTELRFVNVQDWSLLQNYPMIDPTASLGQMHVLTPTGQVAGGFDAILSLLPAFPALRVFHPLLAGPLMKSIGHRVYKWIAANRYRISGTTGCANGACKI